MKLKHAMSVALATLSVGAGVTLLTPRIALAHHATVTGVATCVKDQSGEATGWKVDWTADASNDRDRWKIAESGWSPATEWINVTTNRTKTTNHSLNESSASQTATVTWAYYSASKGINGLYGPASDTETVSKPGGCTSNGDTGWQCPAGTVHDYKIDNLSGATFTVPTPPSGWTILAVIVKAATQHKSYSPVTPGQVLQVKADIGHEVSHVHICKGTVVPTQVSWTATNGTCANPAGSLAVTYDSNQATYTGSAPGSYADGATVSGSFAAKPGFTINGQTSFSHTFSVIGAPCVQTITPPTISGSYDCLSDGPATFTLDPASGNWTASGDQDPSKFGIQVTITANPGFTFADGPTKVLTLTVGEDDSCEVTAVAPTVDPTSVCQQLDSYTIPNTAGVVYSQAPGTYNLNPGEQVTITATAAAGYRLTNPDFSVTLTGGPVEDCVTDPPALTGHYDCLADGPATFTLDPASGNWTASGDQDPSKFGIQVTITANPGYTFADGPIKVLTLTVGEDDSCEVTAVDPTLDVTTECQTLDTLTIPNTPGVVYSPAAGSYGLDPGQSVTVTATAAAGFRLTNPDFSVTVTGGAVEDCLIDPPTLTASYDCVSEESSAALTPTEGEHWTAGPITKVDGENKYTVTITPEAGYRFAGTDGGPIELTATFDVDSDCVIEPPALTASYDCVTQQPSMALSPASSEQWTAGEASLVGNTYSVTITANEGLRFAQGPSITLTAAFEVTTDCERTPVIPKVTPPTCSAPGSVDTTPTEFYTWTKNQDGTYTAVAKPGVRLVGTTTFGPFDLAQLTGDECAEPRIDLAAFGPLCVNEIPFIQYNIVVSGTSANVAKVTLRDVNGNVVAVHENAPLSGKFLYPGANDNPPDWPGWKQVDGKWVTDDTDHIWRQGLSVHVEVNPTADTSVQYPPEGAPCFDPPTVDQGGPTTTTTTTTTTVVGQGGPVPSLPRTGSNSTGMAVTIGAMLLLGGLVLLTAVRRPRRS